MYAFNSKQYFHQFTSLDFRIFPGGFRCIPGEFSYLPGGKFTTRSHPGKALNICHFPLKSSSPYRGNATGCKRGNIKKSVPGNRGLRNLCTLKFTTFLMSFLKGKVIFSESLDKTSLETALQ